MQAKTVARLAAAAVVSVLAFSFLGAAGLWGVALAAPALVFAPSAVKGAARDRRTKKALDAELAVILGNYRGRR